MIVSVVIPTYNRAEMVERAVRSVLAQTYPDLDVIIVDDCSTDNTLERVNQLQQTDRRIRYLRHENNRGAQAARNTGINSAIGEFVAFLDSDNEWLPQKIEKQLALFTHQMDIPGMVYCGFSRVNNLQEVIHEYKPEFRGYLYPQVLRSWLTDTSTIIVRKEFLEQVGGFTDGLKAYHEWDLCIKLSKICVFDFIPEFLAVYHEHALPTISKDLLRDAVGYERVVDLYHDEIVQNCGKNTLSDHYLKLARLFIQAGQFSTGKKYFLESMKFNPLNLKSLLHFIATLLGKDAYWRLRERNHR